MDTSNTTAFIEAQQYSKFIIENLEDGMLPDGFTRDVSDFSEGNTLNIKTIGSATIQDVAEGVPMTFNAIDTGTVTLSITDYIGDAWFVSDELREDGSQVEQLSAARAQEATRAIQENVETKFLQACHDAQTSANVNLVNGRPHRWVAGGSGATDRIFDLTDIVALKLSFDKANAPQEGRILIVDPIVEATLNSIPNLINASNNPQFEGIVTSGFARNHKFIRNIFGFDIYTSNRLPVLTATQVLDASGYGLANDTAEIGDVVNVAMCVADDNTRPMMRAWRRMPKTEGWRDHDNRQDKFQSSSRFGFGAQRVDTLATVISSATAY